MKKEMWNDIEKLSELRSNYSCFDEQEQPYYHALSLGIEGIKALEQEPRKGHWINTANPCMSDNIVCSECGYNSIADFKFCPNCGADMREDEE